MLSGHSESNRRYYWASKPHRRANKRVDSYRWYFRIADAYWRAKHRRYERWWDTMSDGYGLRRKSRFGCIVGVRRYLTYS